MTVYYNEFDPQTAEWLRELIMAGVIADGVVDTRSIEDVRPADLEGFTQCHFFAGIGVWSYALRAAGWPDDRPVWTGSCPCQPFSAAGKGIAFADERHLWPAFHHLIKVRKPECVLGEQVASAAVDPWIDLVHADLEGLGYAFGSVPFPSAGVGAPHIRDRNYWVAHANGEQHDGRRIVRPRGWLEHSNGGAASGLGDTDGGHPGTEWQQRGGQQRQQPEDGGCGGMASVGLANAHGTNAAQEQQSDDAEHAERAPQRGRAEFAAGAGAGSGNGARDSGAGCDGVGIAGEVAGLAGPGPTNGFWRDADWLGCRDGKWRPVEPGTFPLVAGASARVVRLRGYGNAINAKAAQVWIETVMECQP